MCFLKEYEFIRVLDVLDKVSLMVVERKVKNLVREINNLRVVFVELLCLGKLYKEEAAKKDKWDIDGSHDKVESSKLKNGFN